MPFYFYQNWTHKYAKVHRAECRNCNYGKGKIPYAEQGKNGEWSKSFRIFADANRAARQSMRADVRECKICHPSKPSPREVAQKLKMSHGLK